MSKWWWKADYVETCNCAHSCPCNLTMLPTHGACHGMNIYRIREGECDGVKLNGLHLVLAFSWPGPIHRGNGKGMICVDERATPAQRTALEKIGTGEAGPGGPFEIFRSTWVARPEVIVAPIELSISTRRAHYKAGNAGEVKVGPIISDMDGSEANARLVMPDGFIFKDGAIVNVDEGHVHGGGLKFDYSGSSAFISEVTYNA